MKNEEFDEVGEVHFSHDPENCMKKWRRATTTMRAANGEENENEENKEEQKD